LILQVWDCLMSIANFFILGAAKSGTTSLQMYLEQHENIFFSKYKEPNFYTFEGQKLPDKGPVSPALLYKLRYSYCATDFDSYELQFSAHANQKAIGDASVRNLYYPEAAQRIFKRVPNGKFIAILREPVSRLYSHYCMNKQLNLEPLDLIDAVLAESSRIEQKWGWDWHYVNIGLYSKQLKNYYQYFSPDQIKVIFYDQFLEKPTSVISDICEFLEVDKNFNPDFSKRGKVPYLPKNFALDRWLNRESFSRNLFNNRLTRKITNPIFSKVNKLNATPMPKITVEQKSNLSDYFVKETESLEDLLGCKVPWKYKNG
jgi:hypothetical protein